MVIVIGIPCLHTGGTEYQTINLVRALAAAGHRVITACYYEHHPYMVALFESYGSEVVLFSPEGNARPKGFEQIGFIFKNFKKLIAEYKPDIVHIQYMAPGAIPIFVCRWFGVKKVLATVHQPHTPSHGLFSKIILRTSSWFCTAFIVVSKNAESSWFGTSSLFDEHKTLRQQPRHFSIYNSIDTIRIQELSQQVDVNAAKEVQQINSKAFVFGAVSRLREEKGIHVLIDAFSRLLVVVPDLHLHIVGNGPDEKKLKNLVTHLNITNKVTFFGEASWETAMQQMSLMDVVVVPSRFEGFGLTAAEAMAMGKPVIASDVFGLKEVIDPDLCGLIFKNGDIVELENKMEKILHSEELRKIYGVNGIVKVINNFSYKIYKSKMIDLHNKA